MDRCWFFTWRTYGTWLPGEEGFVGDYRAAGGGRRIDNLPGQDTAPAMPALASYSARIMNHPAVCLTLAQARAIVAQLHETAAYRKWRIDALAVLASHVHVVFSVPGDPNPSDLLRDWKSWASWALNRFERRVRWWVDGGSKRPLKTEEQWLAAVRYVRDQEAALVVWLSGETKARLAAYTPAQPNGEPAA